MNKYFFGADIFDTQKRSSVSRTNFMDINGIPTKLLKNKNRYIRQWINETKVDMLAMYETNAV